MFHILVFVLMCVNEQLDIWDKLPQEKQETLVRMEDNATTNQVILFVQRIINLRTPVELPDGESCIQIYILN